MSEKVRGVKHKKKLVGAVPAAASLLGVAGALLILLSSLVPPPPRGGQPETPPGGKSGKDAFNAMTLAEKMLYANEHPSEAAEYLKGE